MHVPRTNFIWKKTIRERKHAVFLELRKHDLFLFGRNLKRIERHIFHLWADIIPLQSPLFKFYFQNGRKTRCFFCCHCCFSFRNASYFSSKSIYAVCSLSWLSRHCSRTVFKRRISSWSIFKISSSLTLTEPY